MHYHNLCHICIFLTWFIHIIKHGEQNATKDCQIGLKSHIAQNIDRRVFITCDVTSHGYTHYFIKK